MGPLMLASLSWCSAHSLEAMHGYDVGSIPLRDFGRASHRRRRIKMTTLKRHGVYLRIPSSRLVGGILLGERRSTIFCIRTALTGDNGGRRFSPPCERESIPPAQKDSAYSDR